MMYAEGAWVEQICNLLGALRYKVRSGLCALLPTKAAAQTIFTRASADGVAVSHGRWTLGERLMVDQEFAGSGARSGKVQLHGATPSLLRVTVLESWCL